MILRFIFLFTLSVVDLKRSELSLRHEQTKLKKKKKREGGVSEEWNETMVILSQQQLDCVLKCV